MKFSLFYHSLLSDWNHGNAHFLRGVVAELLDRGHEVRVYEPEHNWSLSNLLEQHGEQVIGEFREAYPGMYSTFYDPAKLDLSVLDDQDVVIVHEWNDHDLVSRIGAYRKENPHFRLLFHDTHHRAVTEKEAMAGYDLKHYDGVLAFGNVIRNLYLENGWAKTAWTWHEAADTRVFYPQEKEKTGDLVWVGNWGDDERTEELHKFLIRPVKELGLKATIYGVRYPEHALEALDKAGIRYGGWLPNFKAPKVFAKHRLTVHVPRRPYVESLPGIPTIRPFEALACGIPLICSPWKDAEQLFRPGIDYLEAVSTETMIEQMERVLNEKHMAVKLARNGLESIQAAHTCSHRVDQLLSILKELPVSTTAEKQAFAS